LTEQANTDILDSVVALKRLSEEMNDPDLDEAIELIGKAIARPDVPSNKATEAIVKLSGLAAKFGMMSVYYKTFGMGGENKAEATRNRYRKDVYYTARDAINNLVDALKYIPRTEQLRQGR
jgi:hypothetical protein